MARGDVIKRQRTGLPDHVTVACVSRTGQIRHAGVAVIDRHNVVLKGNLYTQQKDHWCNKEPREPVCAIVAALRPLAPLLTVLDDHRTATLQFVHPGTARWVRDWLAGDNPIPAWYETKDMHRLAESVAALGPHRLSVEVVDRQSSPLVVVALRFAATLEDLLASRDPHMAGIAFDAKVAELQASM